MMSVVSYNKIRGRGGCCTKLSNVLFYFCDVLFYDRLSVDRDYLTELK
jgi:hypothetical protein